MKIVICGGGSLGHVCAGVLSSHEGVEVSILTNRPERWSRKVVVTDNNGKEFVADIKVATSNPEEVIPAADIVFLCQPGF